MVLATPFILAAFLLSGTVRCKDAFIHEQRHVPIGQPLAVAHPATPLVWGDINILHTTGKLALYILLAWLARKKTAPEPNYSGDLGTFSSFVTHMKAEAQRLNVDLLLVDSGDMHDGNGITDGFPAGDVNGHEVKSILALLYKYGVAYDVYKNFAPKWSGRYLTSNVNITIGNGNNGSTSVSLGARYAQFKTRLGRSVTALGVLFDFTMNSANTTVQPVGDMVKENWFKEAISDEPDIFLLVGHMPLQNNKWPVVFSAIRAVHPQTPILIFGGHAHIRDCVQLDGRSMSLASGRYMETIGAKLDKAGSTDEIAFSRRYLDANQVTYSYHTGKTGEEFHTARGQSITTSVQALSHRFNLSYQYGISPSDYFLDRVPASSPQSLLSLVISQVLPTILSVSNPRASIPRMIVTNSGALRFDLHAGSFTRNDQFIVSPFTDTFEYLDNVPSSVANKILDELNRSGLPARRKRDLEDDFEALELLNQGNPSAVYKKWMWDQWDQWNMEHRDPTNLTLGYVTKDACPGAGDDVIHAPLPHYSNQPFIGSPPGQSDAFDLVFGGFIRDSVIRMVNTLNAGSRPNVTDANIQPYSEMTTSEAFGLFASIMWN
ncbi:Metallo-dependent phosphatase-like protein [Gautieria morchelliformis]|nr:Metallo-dependent phosphatase-like protein [Gautieria morchelliformis]